MHGSIVGLEYICPLSSLFVETHEAYRREIRLEIHIYIKGVRSALSNSISLLRSYRALPLHWTQSPASDSSIFLPNPTA